MPLQRVPKCHNFKTLLAPDYRLVMIDICQFVTWRGPDQAPLFVVPQALKDKMAIIGSEHPSTHIEVYFYSSHLSLANRYWSKDNPQTAMLQQIITDLLSHLATDKDRYSVKYIVHFTTDELNQWVTTKLPQKLIQQQADIQKESDLVKHYQVIKQRPEIICISSHVILPIRLKMMSKRIQQLINLTSDPNFKISMVHHTLPGLESDDHEALSIQDRPTKRSHKKLSFADSSRLTIVHEFEKNSQPNGKTDHQVFAEMSACSIM